MVMKRCVSFLITSLLVILSFTGCESSSAVANQDSDLRQLLANQKKEIESLHEQVNKLQREQSSKEFEQNWSTIAYLTPGSKGYSILKTDLGGITVSLENVFAYANGSRVVLRFGNLTNATLIDVKATIDYGSVDSTGSPMNDQEKVTDITFDRPFRPSAWNDMAIVLEGVPPSQLGFVRVHDLKPDRIELYRAR